MKTIINAVKYAWNAYCNGSYIMNKSVYEAGLIPM